MIFEFNETRQHKYVPDYFFTFNLVKTNNFVQFILNTSHREVHIITDQPQPGYGIDENDEDYYSKIYDLDDIESAYTELVAVLDRYGMPKPTLENTLFSVQHSNGQDQYFDEEDNLDVTHQIEEHILTQTFFSGHTKLSEAELHQKLRELKQFYQRINPILSTKLNDTCNEEEQCPITMIPLEWLREHKRLIVLGGRCYAFYAFIHTTSSNILTKNPFTRDPWSPTETANIAYLQQYVNILRDEYEAAPWETTPPSRNRTTRRGRRHRTRTTRRRTQSATLGGKRRRKSTKR
jgi:hypothetical protein